MADEEEEEEEEVVVLGSMQVPLRPVVDAFEDIMLLWALGQPQAAPQNAFVRQSSESLRLDACGHILTIVQAPSALNEPGVTGAVLWDSAVILGKFLEHANDLHLLNLRGKRCVELGAGCGFVGCVATLLGAEVILTDLPDRLRLLQKNVAENTGQYSTQVLASVQELTWGEELDESLITPFPEFVLASDVVYNEKAVEELLCTLKWMCCSISTVILATELRNDAILEYFLESALKDFCVWRVPQSQWHPDFRSQRIAIYIMTKCQPE